MPSTRRSTRDSKEIEAAIALRYSVFPRKVAAPVIPKRLRRYAINEEGLWDLGRSTRDSKEIEAGLALFTQGLIPVSQHP